MGAGHAHAHESVPLHLRRGPGVAVLAAIALAGLVALVAAGVWWPDAKRVDHLRGLFPVTAKGVVVVHAALLDVRTACSGGEASGTRCGDSRARLLDGRQRGREVRIALTPDVVATGLKAGDHVLLLDTAGTAGAASAPAAGTSAPTSGTDASDFSFYRADRAPPLIGLALLFALAVVLVARRRGLMALIGLAFAGLVVAGFLVPALLSGRPPVPVTLAAATLILIVLLYLTHGFSMRTSVALLGALIGVGISTLFAWFGVVGTRLAGLGDDAAGLLTFNVPSISVQQLVLASVILAGLGTLNDVTVTQVSALWELRAASPAMPRRELFRSAMRIGRDHVASTVYTLVFAYLGTALVLLVAVQLYGGSPLDLATAEDVAEEVVRALVGGIALVLAMPVTTALGALVLTDAVPEASGGTTPYRRHAPVSRVDRPQRQDAFQRLPQDPWQAD